LPSPETANQTGFDYRTQHRNLCNKHMSAGTHHDPHGDLHEHEVCCACGTSSIVM